MSVPRYPSKPVETTGIPPGIPYIIGNEAAERFSFYGMRTILVVFMTQYLMNAQGQLAPMPEAEARAWFHTFVSAVYFLPILGAILSDALLGKYRTIFYLSIVYCFGHLALAIDDTRIGLAIGLTLIAVGSGGIKPCVSANVGDQFGRANQHLLPRVFGWFYFSINFGSFFSTLLTPWLLKHHGPAWAFGVPGIFMFLATLIFWMGRNKFVRVPPAGMQFVKDLFSLNNLKIIGRLVPIYLCVAMFWALWDQTSSAWVLQAEKMDRQIFGREILSSQVQAINPLLILILIPFCSYILYPLIDRVWKLTPLRKIGLGFFLTVPSFVLTAWVESQIQAGHHPHISWQFLAFVIISLAEVMVSITCLEFSYTQAPVTLKSLVMSVYLLSISLGNAFTAAINHLIQNPDGSSKLDGTDYYLFFTALMAITSLVYVFIAGWYKEQPVHLATEATEK
ncbi:POT family MFS transporter [Fontisphaera persica]|uniref:POT family MFS transporter n=1 Tax=Fontisphaera persica TaxID=2974023 RepID=UPI0024BF8DD6|nr:POT family MFS transporter [Fontisphaera persica]WCJ60448.1 POT family MFS transporter [Fontisphaera persica]